MLAAVVVVVMDNHPAAMEALAVAVAVALEA
jgi:hypothetical protein